jgi:hypothetical protein
MKKLNLRYLPLVIPVIILLLINSCMKDQGNYAYQNINKVQLTDTLSGEAKLLTVSRLTQFGLTPDVKMSVSTDQSNLTYEWKIRDNNVWNNPMPYTILGTTKNLTVPSLDVAPGIWRIIYKVTDKTTNVSVFLYYNLKVVGDYSEGWLLLEEVSQGGDLAMILPTDKIVRNIYSKENNEFFEKPCVSLNVGSLLSPKKAFVLTKSKGVEVDYQTYFKLGNFDDWFVTGTAARPVMPQLYKFTSSYYGGLVNNNQFHARIGGGFPGSPAFGGPIPPPVEANGFRLDYNIAPLIVGGRGNIYQVIYDNLQKRFLYLTLNGLTPELRYFPDCVTGDAFDPKSTGMTMLFMGDGSVTYQHLALMKDASNVLYFVRYRSDVLNVTGARFPMEKKAAPTALNGFSTCVNATQLDHMYVGVGNNIYKYDVPANSASIIYTFTNSNEVPVTMRMFNLYTKNQLVVSTWDGTQGRVYYFDIAPTGAITGNTFSKKFEGFGKIDDIQYKN